MNKYYNNNNNNDNNNNTSNSFFFFFIGNYKDSFETRQLSPTQILIRNNNDITGPRDLKLVLHSDVVDYENRIVDRFVYNLIFNLGEYEF